MHMHQPPTTANPLTPDLIPTAPESLKKTQIPKRYKLAKPLVERVHAALVTRDIRSRRRAVGMPWTSGDSLDPRATRLAVGVVILTATVRLSNWTIHQF